MHGFCLFCDCVLTCSTIVPVYFTANAPAMMIPPNITAEGEAKYIVMKEGLYVG